MRPYRVRCQARYRPPGEQPSGVDEGRIVHLQPIIAISPLDVGEASEMSSCAGGRAYRESGGIIGSTVKLFIFFFLFDTTIYLDRSAHTILNSTEQLRSWPKSSSIPSVFWDVVSYLQLSFKKLQQS